MTEPIYVSEQFSLSTADEENALIIDVEDLEVPAPPPPALQPGQYRVIAGELFRLVPGSPAT